MGVGVVGVAVGGVAAENKSKKKNISVRNRSDIYLSLGYYLPLHIIYPAFPKISCTRSEDAAFK